MRINSIYVQNSTNNFNQNFKGKLNLDNDMKKLCGINDKYIQQWNTILPDRTSVSFAAVNSDYVENNSYIYIVTANDKTIKIEYLDLSTKNIGFWSPFNKDMKKTQNENKTKLSDCLKSCLEFINENLGIDNIKKQFNIK